MAEVIKPLPPEAVVLPTKTRLWYLIALNRIRIGITLLLLTGFYATFVDDADVKTHRRIHIIEQLIMLVTGATGVAAISGAKFKSNAFHEREMHAEIRGASNGLGIPVYADRRNDVEPEARHRP